MTRYTAELIFLSSFVVYSVAQMLMTQADKFTQEEVSVTFKYVTVCFFEYENAGVVKRLR